MTVLPAGALPWQTYRDVRLRALSTNPEAFGSTFARESEFTEQVWAERAMSPGTYLWMPDAGEPEASSQVAPRADGLIGLRPGQIYFDDPAVVGALGYEAHAIAFVVQMWVEPTRRGAGVFDALVDAVISDAREQGLRAIGLHVYRANERAAAAYRRRGFRLVENPTAECPADEAEYLLPL